MAEGSGESNIKVFVRVRPAMNEEEPADGFNAGSDGSSVTLLAAIYTL